MASSFTISFQKNYLVENAHQFNQLRHINMPASISEMKMGNSHTGIHLFTTHRSCVSSIQAKSSSKVNILYLDLSEANNNGKLYPELETLMPLSSKSSNATCFSYFKLLFNPV